MGTIIIDDDQFHLASGEIVTGFVPIVGGTGFYPFIRKIEFGPIITVGKANISSNIIFPLEEKSRISSNIKFPLEKKIIILNNVLKLYESDNKIKSGVAPIYEESGKVKSDIIFPFQESESIKSIIKHLFTESVDLKCSLIYWFEEAHKIQPDLTSAEFSEWIKQIIKKGKQKELDSLNREIDFVKSQMKKTQLNHEILEQLQKKINFLENEKIKLKKKIKLQKILKILEEL